jgi:hypothetical protein
VLPTSHLSPENEYPQLRSLSRHIRPIFGGCYGDPFYVDFVGVRPLPAADFVAQAVPATAVPGQGFEMTVMLRNRGPETWTREAG